MKGNDEQMQAMLCGCGRRLQASDYESLVAQVIEHLRRDHPGIRVGEVGLRAVREIVAARSYRFEEVAFYQDNGADGSEKGLIPEPY